MCRGRASQREPTLLKFSPAGSVLSSLSCPIRDSTFRSNALLIQPTSLKFSNIIGQQPTVWTRCSSPASVRHLNSRFSCCAGVIATDIVCQDRNTRQYRAITTPGTSNSTLYGNDNLLTNVSLLRHCVKLSWHSLPPMSLPHQRSLLPRTQMKARSLHLVPGRRHLDCRQEQHLHRRGFKLSILAPSTRMHNDLTAQRPHNDCVIARLT